ncbi:MAG: tetratricopeptide repeat protein [Candidatus Marinimicrobia bacterium]|nr:tetratricopeptide repeat protein [Candidatus Neomarinimicrobiota bacterium]
MEQINYYEDNQSVLKHLEKNETNVALEKAKLLLKKYPKEALIWFSMGLCYYQKDDIFKAIESFTRSLNLDPSFISAAEMLLKLNKDNYSLGELKYIYSLIVSYKKGTEEMYNFIQKFKDIAMNPKLSIPDIGQDKLKTEDLPGIDNNAYIQHLITEMDKPEQKTQSTIPHRKEISIIPEQQFVSPPKKKIPVQNNKNDQNIRYGIETLTMAKLYIRQGLFEQAMNILLKLQQRDPGSELVNAEIDHVKQLIKNEKKES